MKFNHYAPHHQKKKQKKTYSVWNISFQQVNFTLHALHANISLCFNLDWLKLESVYRGKLLYFC